MSLPYDRWIGDYRSTGFADWPDGLRATIRATSRRALRRMLLWVGIALAVVLFTTAGAIFADSLLPRPHSDTLLISLIFVAAICLVVITLCFCDAFKLHATLSRVLRFPRVERFELSPHIRDEVAAAQSLGINASLDGVPTVFLVIPAPDIHPPAPSLLLQIDDKPFGKPRDVFIRSLPHTAAATALAVSPTAIALPTAPSSPTGPVAGTQLLEPAELAELRRYIAEYRRTTLFSLFVCTGLTIAVIIIAGFLAIGFLTPTGNLYLTCFAPILWLLSVSHVFGPGRRQRRMLKLFSLDVRDGLTHVLEGHAVIAELRNAGLLDPRQPVVNPGIVRRLPHSRLWWDVDGVPADWRR